MRDFTFNTYKKLLESLQAKGYSFQMFKGYIQSHPDSFTLSVGRRVLLRHDVEKNYAQALKFAQIQNQLGIKGTYFFRLLPKSFKPEIVKNIAELGHEIGYHYDDLAVCKGDYKKAIERFQKNLETLREIAPVQTICMDGSPLSKYDNKELWSRTDPSPSSDGSVRDGAKERNGEGEMERNDENMKEDASLNRPVSQSLSLSLAKSHYHHFGIIAEPYFDIDFSQVFYLTDTGRMWDGEQYSVRDKVLKDKTQEWPSYHSTQDIISAVEQGVFPKQAMMTFHPQRWNDAFLPWFKELVFQNLKNQVKRFLVKR